MNVDTLINEIRGNWFPEDREAVQGAVRRLHRTEQQNVVRNIVEILIAIGANREDGLFDARNEASSKWASEVTKSAPHFPFI